MALVIIISKAMVRFGGVNMSSPGKFETLRFFATGHKIGRQCLETIAPKTREIACLTWSRLGK
jgi:hypothetical protein